MPRTAPLLCTLLFAGCAAGPSAAIPEEPSCADCVIEVEPLLTIGDTTQGGMLNGRPMAVFEDGHGRYWINVLDMFPMVYDPASKALRTFGREGDGPGEFRHPSVIGVLPGDSVLLRDMHRISVVGPNDSVARIIADPSGGWMTDVIRWPDLLLGRPNPYVGGKPRHSVVFATYDLSGNEAVVRDTLLAIDRPLDLRDPAAYASSLRQSGSVSPTGVFWIGDVNQYRLVRYTLDGAAGDTIIRQIDWFIPGQPMYIGGPDRLVSPQLDGNWLDDEHRLWVLVAQPIDPGNAWDNVENGAREVRMSALPPDFRLKRTLIEVIDPATRRVVTRHTFDGYVFGTLPGNRVATYAETDNGIPILTIHRLTLRGLD